jgi:hypothetical protein
MAEKPNKHIQVRELTELRKDTTEKQASALETRIEYFQKQKKDPIVGQIEEFIASVATAGVEIKNQIDKMIPEATRNQILDFYKKLMLSF